ncbi:major facilitator superfamily domain-containing protein [Linnemannia elongata]|nr:major facilitator superfamily domain-containing protein [Linnemannia elongata]
MDSTITKATPTDQDIQERLGNEKTHSRSTSSGSTVLQGVPSAEVTAGQIDPEKAAVGSFTQAPTASTSTEIEEARSSNTNMAPPDGGYGWVVVGACFLNNFSMLGIMFSWGIFQQLYKDEVFPGQTSAVSWIGTLAFGFMYIVGGVCSLFAAKIGYRKMILMGSVFVAGGCVGASFATQVWHLYLTQGILYGLGAAMANPCILAAPSQWFVVRRGMASGIGISGSGVGGLVFSVLIEKLNASIGHRWCLRVLGIIVWCSMVTSAILIRQFSPNGAQAVNVSMKDAETMRKPAFLLLLSGVLLTSFGYFSPLNLLPSYAVDHNLTRSQGAMLNSFLNGASFFGRFAGGIFGDRFGLVNLTVFCVGASALTTLVIWMFATTLPVLLVYVILYGLMGGGFISLLAPVLAEQFGTGSLTILVGITFGVNGLGSLLGTPIATAILASLGGDIVDGVAPNSDKGYRGAVGFIGGVMAVGTCVFFLLKLKVGGKSKVVA